MTRTKSKPQTSGNTGPRWKYVNYRPNEEEKTLITATYEQLEDPRDLIADLAQGKQKIGIEYDEDNSTYIVTLMDKDPKTINKAMTLSARHLDPFKALTALLVAHEACDGLSWEELEKSQQVHDW